MNRDLEVIRDRWRASLLPTDRRDVRAVLDAALPHCRTLRPDGTWADVDYADATQWNHWGPADHASHLNLLARAYAVANEGSDRNRLRDTAVAALGWWAVHDPKCPNWWWNEIGIGEYLSESLLCLGSAVPQNHFDYVTGVLLPRSDRPGTGANLVWLRENRVARGVLTDQPEVVAAALKDIYGEIRLVAPTEEGIQVDYSFHQHGAQFYNGGYGFFYGNDCARFAAFAWGTRFQIPSERLGILAGYLLEGQQWMIRGDVFDYSAIGRVITRPDNVAVPRSWVIGPISPSGAAYGLPHAADLLGNLRGIPRREEFARFARRLWAGETLRPIGEVTGNRHYWRSDYMAHRRDGFLFSIRMYSRRLQNTEMVIGEGTRSHHLADGASLLYRTGGEYRNIFPLWDWRKIPGTTAEQGKEDLSDRGGVGRKGVTDFVGGVSDGQIGLTAFDFVRGPLRARKTWACFDDVIVCLGAGITSDGPLPLVTTVEQCWADKSGIVSGRNGISHGGVGYWFPDGYPPAKVTRERRTGRWSDFGGGPKDPVTGDVFQAIIEHGVRPNDDRSRYAYFILPGADPAATAKAGNRARVLVNTPQAQAAFHPASGALLAVLYEPGEVYGDAWTLSADQPCAVSLRPLENEKGWRVAVSNPANQPLSVTIQLRRDTQNLPPLYFDLPGGADAGKSVVRDIEWKT